MLPLQFIMTNTLCRHDNFKELGEHTMSTLQFKRISRTHNVNMADSKNKSNTQYRQAILKDFVEHTVY